MCVGRHWAKLVFVMCVGRHRARLVYMMCVGRHWARLVYMMCVGRHWARLVHVMCVGRLLTRLSSHFWQVTRSLMKSLGLESLKTPFLIVIYSWKQQKALHCSQFSSVHVHTFLCTMSETSLFWHSVLSRPTWLCPKELKCEAKKCMCCINIDRTTVRSLQMKKSNIVNQFISTFILAPWFSSTLKRSFCVPWSPLSSGNIHDDVLHEKRSFSVPWSPLSQETCMAMPVMKKNRSVLWWICCVCASVCVVLLMSFFFSFQSACL